MNTARARALQLEQQYRALLVLPSAESDAPVILRERGVDASTPWATVWQLDALDGTTSAVAVCPSILDALEARQSGFRGEVVIGTVPDSGTLGVHPEVVSADVPCASPREVHLVAREPLAGTYAEDEAGGMNIVLGQTLATLDVLEEVSGRVVLVRDPTAYTRASLFGPDQTYLEGRASLDGFDPLVDPIAPVEDIIAGSFWGGAGTGAQAQLAELASYAEAGEPATPREARAREAARARLEKAVSEGRKRDVLWLIGRDWAQVRMLRMTEAERARLLDAAPWGTKAKIEGALRGAALQLPRRDQGQEQGGAGRVEDDGRVALDFSRDPNEVLTIIREHMRARLPSDGDEPGEQDTPARRGLWFAYGGQLVSMSAYPPVVLRAGALSHEIAKHFRCYQRQTQKGGAVREVPYLPSRQWVDTIAASYVDYPRVRSVTRTPYIRPMTPSEQAAGAGAGYQLCFEQGFDPTDGVYLRPDIQVRTSPGDPKPADIHAALEFLWSHMIRTIGFEDEVEGVANYLGLLIGGMTRRYIPGNMPISIFNSRSAARNIGKTTAASMMSILLTGEKNLQQFSDEDDEIRKKILATLSEDPDAIILFDNVTDPLVSPSLASLVTTRTFADRRLHTSDMVKVEHAVMVLFSVNEGEVDEDMGSRSVFIDMKYKEPGERIAQPETRVRQHRGGLVSSVLLLLRAWYAAGCPEPEHREEYFNFRYLDALRVMAGVLDVAGVKGFLQNRLRRNLEAENDKDLPIPLGETLRWIISEPTARERFTVKVPYSDDEGAFDCWRRAGRLHEVRGGTWGITPTQVYDAWRAVAPHTQGPEGNREDWVKGRLQRALVANFGFVQSTKPYEIERTGARSTVFVCPPQHIGVGSNGSPDEVAERAAFTPEDRAARVKQDMEALLSEPPIPCAPWDDDEPPVFGDDDDEDDLAPPVFG